MQAYVYKSSQLPSNYNRWVVINAPKSDNVTRVPVHIIAVIDTSGSMNYYNKLVNVKKSLIAIIDTLNTNDIFSLITFSHTYKVELDSVKVTDDIRFKVKQIIKSMHADGSTNLSGGLLSACMLNIAEGHKTSILLLTDGEANHGITDPDALIDMIRNNCDANTTIHTFGYGEDHNSKLLSLIAEERSGGYNLVNNLEDVASSIANAFGSSAFCALQAVSVACGADAEYKCGYLVKDNKVCIGDMMVDGEIGILVKIPDGVEAAFEIQGFNIQTNMLEKLSIAEAQETPDSELLAAKKTLMRLKVAEYIECPPSLDAVKAFDAECKALLGETDMMYITMKHEIDRLIRILGVPDPLNTAFIDDAAAQRQHINYFRNLRTIYTNTEDPVTSEATPGNIRRHDIFTGLSPVARSVSEAVYARATRSDIDT